MPHNAASYAEDLAVKAGKPPQMRGPKGARRGWKAFYGSVHDIYSYPCEVSYCFGTGLRPRMETLNLSRTLVLALPPMANTCEFQTENSDS
jgi:hypothetical protein